jgi:hypothetical protein
MDEDILRAMRTIVNYNWDDEKRDYEECLEGNGNSTAGHIFQSLRDVSDYLTEKGF